MSTATSTGTLFLVPVSLGESAWDVTHPAQVRNQACELTHFVVENAKTARAELKRLEHPKPMRELDIRELPASPSAEELEALLAPLLAGNDLGLMSEAGCPAVADPGALLVGAAHRHGIRVTPLTGPSSLLLALMGSGLNGQRFAFHGYLPVDEKERARRLRELEAESRRQDQTQLFIETPYRNDRMFDALLANCDGHTRLCVACDLSTAEEWIGTDTIGAWRKRERPAITKRPTIFLLLAG